MRLLTILLLAAVAASCTSSENREGLEGLKSTPAERHSVKRAISGDSIELDTGEVIRYAAISAPRSGEPFFEEARLGNDQCVVGSEVVVEVRFLEDMRDEDGHRYANVSVPARTLQVSLWVNAELLELGLARLDYRSTPSGLERFLEIREENAREARRGIWSRPQ